MNYSNTLFVGLDVHKKKRKRDILLFYAPERLLTRSISPLVNPCWKFRMSPFLPRMSPFLPPSFRSAGLKPVVRRRDLCGCSHESKLGSGARTNAENGRR